MEKMSVYLVNLARYHSSGSSGAWFTLPLDPEEVKERLELSSVESEYAIHDTDNFPFEIGEYVSIEELNRIYHKLEELPDWLIGGLKDAVSIVGTFDETCSAYENGRFTYYDGIEEVVDLAYYLIDECGILGEIPECLARYIDHEAFARDYAIENMLFSVPGGLCEYKQG